MAKTMKINFGGVPKEIRKGGSVKHIPEGDYAFKIISHEVKKKEGATSRYLNWRLQVSKGPKKGSPMYYITSLKPDALWNLRNFIHAATGKNVAGKSVEFNAEKLYGKEVGGSVIDDEYEGKIRSKLDTVFPIEELSDTEEDDDEDEDTDEEEEEEEEDEDDLEDVDVEDL